MIKDIKKRLLECRTQIEIINAFNEIYASLMNEGTSKEEILTLYNSAANEAQIELIRG